VHDSAAFVMQCKHDIHQLGGGAGLADDNARVQAAAANMLNLALTLPDAPADLASVLVSFKRTYHDCISL